MDNMWTKSKDPPVHGSNHVIILEQVAVFDQNGKIGDYAWFGPVMNVTLKKG
jgi:hypothetical protein